MEQPEQNCFILVSRDVMGFWGDEQSGFDAARIRIENNAWPIYDGTPNRRSFKSGDVCLFYIAGGQECSQHFIGEATISEVLANSKAEAYRKAILVESTLESVLKLEKCQLYKKPVSIKSILQELDFIPKNTNKWGAVMQSGCRKIPRDDYLLIRDNAHAS